MTGEGAYFCILIWLEICFVFTTPLQNYAKILIPAQKCGFNDNAYFCFPVLLFLYIYYLNTWRLTLLTVGLSSHLADETGRRITFQKLSHELWAICVMPSKSSIALTPLSDDVFVFF